MKRKRITAAELMAQLNADPDYVAMRAKKEDELQQRAAEWRRAEEPLIQELRACGFEVESSWDLVNTATPYPQALPILLRHLSRPYPRRVREGIARALAVPDSRFAWPVLVAAFRNEQDKFVKDGIAVALAAAADDEVLSELIELARDRRYGPSRMLLLGALDRSSDPRAQQTLVDLQSDPEVNKEIEQIFKRRARNAARREARRRKRQEGKASGP